VLGGGAFPLPTQNLPIAGSHSVGAARIALNWRDIITAFSSSASTYDQGAPAFIVVAVRLCASSKAARRTRSFSTCEWSMTLLIGAIVALRTASPRGIYSCLLPSFFRWRSWLALGQRCSKISTMIAWLCSAALACWFGAVYVMHIKKMRHARKPPRYIYLMWLKILATTPVDALWNRDSAKPRRR